MRVRWGDIEANGVSLSRLGDLTRVKLTGSEDPPARAWRDDPTPAELAEMDREERTAA